MGSGGQSLQPSSFRFDCTLSRLSATAEAGMKRSGIDRPGAAGVIRGQSPRKSALSSPRPRPPKQLLSALSPSAPPLPSPPSLPSLPSSATSSLSQPSSNRNPQLPTRQQLASERTPLTSFAPAPSTVSCVPLTRNLSPADPSARVRGWTRLAEATAVRALAIGTATAVTTIGTAITTTTATTSSSALSTSHRLAGTPVVHSQCPSACCFSHQLYRHRRRATTKRIGYNAASCGELARRALLAGCLLPKFPIIFPSLLSVAIFANSPEKGLLPQRRVNL